jgi:hypothetical protein
MSKRSRNHNLRDAVEEFFSPEKRIRLDMQDHSNHAELLMAFRTNVETPTARQEPILQDLAQELIDNVQLLMMSEDDNRRKIQEAIYAMWTSLEREGDDVTFIYALCDNAVTSALDHMYECATDPHSKILRKIMKIYNMETIVEEVLMPLATDAISGLVNSKGEVLTVLLLEALKRWGADCGTEILSKVLDALNLQDIVLCLEFIRHYEKDYDIICTITESLVLRLSEEHALELFCKHVHKESSNYGREVFFSIYRFLSVEGKIKCLIQTVTDNCKDDHILCGILDDLKKDEYVPALLVIFAMQPQDIDMDTFTKFLESTEEWSIEVYRAYIANPAWHSYLEKYSDEFIKTLGDIVANDDRENFIGMLGTNNKCIDIYHFIAILEYLNFKNADFYINAMHDRVNESDETIPDNQFYQLLFKACIKASDRPELLSKFIDWVIEKAPSRIENIDKTPVGHLLVQDIRTVKGCCTGSFVPAIAQILRISLNLALFFSRNLSVIESLGKAWDDFESGVSSLTRQYLAEALLESMDKCCVPDTPYRKAHEKSHEKGALKLFQYLMKTKSDETFSNLVLVMARRNLCMDIRNYILSRHTIYSTVPAKWCNTLINTFY